MFLHEIGELVQTRSSWRSYQKRGIDPEKTDQMSEFLAHLHGGLFASKMRFMMVASEQSDYEDLKKLGTYGFIKNAPAFIVGAVEPGRFDLEDFGYAMETAILKATDIGLGTCWLGATFHKSNFTRRARVSEKELIPAVAAIGYPTSQRGTFDKIVRFGAGSKKRKKPEELFFDGSFGVPLKEEAAGEYFRPLQMVRLAPSASNRQPWRIVKEKDKPHRSRALCGHFALATRSLHDD